MVYIFEDHLQPSAKKRDIMIFSVARGLQEGCRAGIWCAALSICECPVLRSDLVESQYLGGDQQLCDLAQYDYLGRAG